MTARFAATLYNPPTTYQSTTRRHAPRTSGDAGTVVARIDVRTGGNTWTMARVLRRLGRRVSFVATSVLDGLTAAVFALDDPQDRASVTWLEQLEAPTPRFVSITSGGDVWFQAVSIAAVPTPPEERLDRLDRELFAAIGDGRVAVVTSSVQPSVFARIVSACRSAGVTIIAVAASEPTAAMLAAHLDWISVLVLNEAEARALAGPQPSADVEALGRALAERVPNVVITLGARGSALFTAQSPPLICAAPDVEAEFENALGAGDAFAACIVEHVEVSGTLSRAALERASAVAALTCQSSANLVAGFDPAALDEMIQAVRATRA